MGYWKDSPLRPLHENDGEDHSDGEDKDHNPAETRHLAGPHDRQKLHHAGRQPGDDPGEDDQRDTISNAPARDLLAHPHQQHGATGQGDDGRKGEEGPWIHHQARAGLQTGRNRRRLYDGQNHSEIAGVLIEGLAPGFPAFLPQLLPRRIDGAQQLDDDRGGNVWTDVQGEDRHPLHGAAGEQVEHSQNALRLPLEGRRKGRRIDPGNGQVGPKPIDHQHHQGEEDPLVKLGRLLEGAEIHVCGKLLSGRSHGTPSLVTGPR